MKKLLFVDRYFYPDLQATAVILRDLVSELSKDFKITVICGPASGFSAGGGPATFYGGRDDGSERTFGHNPKVVTLPAFQFNNPNLFERFLNYVFFLVLVPFAVLFQSGQDAVFVQSSPPLLPFVTSVACRIRQFPYVYVCQDFFPGTAVRSGQLKEGIFTRFFLRLHKLVVKHAKRVVVIGRDMKEVLMAESGRACAVEIIPNWSNVSEIQVLPKSNPFSKTHSLTNCFVVMHSGNFGLVQDFDFLLDVAEKLADDPKIRFVFVGDGTLRRSVIEKAQSRHLTNILFLPFVPRSQISEMFASADLHIVSLKKGLAGYSVPSKTYSLLASGRPILGLLEERSESAHLIGEANCGIVMENASAMEAADKIKNLARNPEELSKWGRNARAFVEMTNFRDAAFQKYRKLLSEIIQ